MVARSKLIRCVKTGWSCLAGIERFIARKHDGTSRRQLSLTGGIATRSDRLLSRWMIAVVALSFASMPTRILPGQETTFGLSSFPVPSAGEKRVPSCPDDPLMTTREELAVWELLSRPHEILGSLDAEMDLEELAERLSQCFPIVLDRVAIKGFGLTTDCAVEIPLSRSDLPLATIILEALSPLDLTILHKSGYIKITSTEAALESLATRIYDVSELVDQMEGDSTIDDLCEVIQIAIEPEIWQDLGGTAVMVPLTRRGRRFLIVSAPTVNHWEIDSLLNRVAEMGDVSLANAMRLHRSRSVSGASRRVGTSNLPRASRLPRSGQAASPVAGVAEDAASTAGFAGDS
ncbi:MAG: hypothetical protein AAGD07_11560 [Planctomycetota bacterium]